LWTPDTDKRWNLFNLVVVTDAIGDIIVMETASKRIPLYFTAAGMLQVGLTTCPLRAAAVNTVLNIVNGTAVPVTIRAFANGYETL
jgi:hypothetical protein